jgi:DNA-binding transcriptional MerR regulator
MLSFDAKITTYPRYQPLFYQHYIFIKKITLTLTSTRAYTAVMNNDKTNIYTISDLAQRFDITTRAIRFYESEGLLSPEREGQKRLYHHKDFITLKLILRGKRLGWSLAESRELIQMYGSGKNNQQQYQKVLEKVQESRERLQQQLNDIEIMMVELEEHEDRVKQALAAS